MYLRTRYLVHLSQEINKLVDDGHMSLPRNCKPPDDALYVCHAGILLTDWKFCPQALHFHRWSKCLSGSSVFSLKLSSEHNCNISPHSSLHVSWSIHSFIISRQHLHRTCVWIAQFHLSPLNSRGSRHHQSFVHFRCWWIFCKQRHRPCAFNIFADVHQQFLKTCKSDQHGYVYPSEKFINDVCRFIP